MALTVTQLARDALPASPEGDEDVLIRRIRGWTLSGVLRPTGDVHTGVGKHRRYHENEAYFVALAEALTHWHIPVGILDGIVQAARRELEGDVNPTREPMTFIKNAISGKEGVFLFVRFTDAVGGHHAEVKLGFYEELASEIAEAGWTKDTPSFLAVNLSALFSKVGK
jgi:hypothetical protein